MLKKGVANILNTLAECINQVSYNIIGGIREGEKIPQRAYEIITLDSLMEVASDNNMDLGIIKSNPYIYNGSYWEKVELSVFKKFLLKAATKMGVPNLTARHNRFISLLVDQFFTVAEEVTKQEGKVVINCQNGTLDISPTGWKLMNFDKENGLTYQLPYSYDKDAKCPKFLKFLNEVLPDKSCQMVLAEFLGYCFTKHLKFEKMLVLLGQGSNGKSVIYEIVNAIFGKANISSYSLSGLTDPKSYSRPRLAEALLNYGSEMSGKIDGEALRQLISGEPVEAREIYGSIQLMDDYSKLAYNTNHAPKNLLDTHSARRRLLLMPFDEILSAEKQDKHLAEKIIKEELSGILNWILEGLSRLLEQDGFTHSKLINDTIAYHSKTFNSIALFIEEEKYISDAESKIYKADFYKKYKRFCTDNGYSPDNRTEVRNGLFNLKIVEGEDNRGMFYNLKRQG